MVAGAGMSETQQTITEWADRIFGPVKSNARAAARVNEEVAELLKALTTDDHHPKAGHEIADVMICLLRLASSLGVDVQGVVEEKMAINRARSWRVDGTGHGYHVKSVP